jgi:hypothetical protein
VALPPLLVEHPRPVQALLAVVVPTVYGAVTGILLGISEPVYLVLTLLAILGGVAAGFDHLGAAGGARRGALGGLLFGAAILVAHELSGEAAEAELPEPAVLLAVVTTVFGVLLGALGGRLRARAQRRAG